MDRAQYEAIVRDAIDALPEQLKKHVEHVAIVIEDEHPDDPDLLGLYEGIPLTEWGRGVEPALPDKITLYRLSIEDEAETDDEIPHIVRETLWHELAHYFGYEHDKIDEMEERWMKKRSA